MSELSLQARLHGGERRLRRRKVLNLAVESLATLAAVIAIGLLGVVVVSVIIEGAGAFGPNLFLHSEVPFGEKGGGIANAIVGTAELVAIATAIAVPIGILIAIYTQEFAPPAVGDGLRLVLDVLNGVPTIVTGIFIFGLLVVGSGQSGFAGALSLAIIMLPIVARSAQEVLALVPRSLREGGLALGVARWKVLVRVVLPSAAGGLLTGALLAVARVAGETAPLLFTSSIFAQGISTNPAHALASIPLRIFQLAEGNSPEEHSEAWAAALLLLALVLALNLLARFFYARTKARAGANR